MMNKRNIFFAMILSSFLGGVIAIGGYTLVVPQKVNVVTPAGQGNPVSFTNYVFDTTNMVVPEGLNFVYASRAATPAVVHIRTTFSGSQGYTARTPFDELFRDFYGDRFDRRERIPGSGAGSGVILSPDGYIVTNNHVVENAEEIEVVLSDNRSFRAELIGTDPDTDLALIRIDEEDLPYIQIGDSENIQIGEWVLAIGNPYQFRSTVTAGIVSAKGRNINILGRGQGDRASQIEAFIQTDAAVNPGNSGGALVNLKGELIGINTAIISPTGAFAGYSFAVPSTLVRKVVGDLKDFGTVQRPFLGISITDVNAEIAEENKLDVLRGVFVLGVQPGSSAEDAKLKEGDVIIEINGKKVSSTAQLQEQVALKRPGDKVEVTFIRDGATRTVTAKLKNIDKTTEIVKVANTVEVEGAQLQSVPGSLSEELGISGGVQVKKVGGKWSNAGVEEGFIITRIERSEVKTPEDVQRILGAVKGQEVLILGVYPDGTKAYYTLGW